jgi:hypothetical protein
VRILVLLTAILSWACDRGSPDSDASRTSASAQTALTVRPDGVGRLTFGVTLAEAHHLMGDSLRPQYEPYADFPTCDYVYSARLSGMAFMVRRDSVGAVSRVERLDVTEPGVMTEEGISVGDSEARVTAVYGARLTRTANHQSPSPDAAFLLLTTADSAFRLVFEVDRGKVSAFRAGHRAATEMGEGCS